MLHSYGVHYNIKNTKIESNSIIYSCFYLELLYAINFKIEILFFFYDLNNYAQYNILSGNKQFNLNFMKLNYRN